MGFSFGKEILSKDSLAKILKRKEESIMNLILPSLRGKITIVAPYRQSKKEKEGRLKKIRELVSSLYNSNRHNGNTILTSIAKKSSS